MQTQINRELLVNPALIQENRRLKAELEKANEQNAMLREALNKYRAKSAQEYSGKCKTRRKVGDIAAEIVLAGRWVFGASALMVIGWHVWMAVWGINI